MGKGDYERPAGMEFAIKICDADRKTKELRH